MATTIGSIVHPWYKGTHGWQVKDIVALTSPVKYKDPDQGDVSYDPKMMLLENETKYSVLWFPYWMATSKTAGKMKWGQRPPVLEEAVFLELLKKAINNGFFSKDFLKSLADELRS